MNTKILYNEIEQLVYSNGVSPITVIKEPSKGIPNYETHHENLHQVAKGI